MTVKFSDPQAVMQRALEIAARGAGSVEPNPLVGAVIVDDDLQLIGEGYHELFGGPHAEVNAIADAGDRASGATMYVTLEPCVHFGKTPPCADAVCDARISRVVIATRDPSPHTAGQGIAVLKAAGITVEEGLLEDRAHRLTAPFLKLLKTNNPYVHAKWAMTLDGKLAARSGHSQWISNEASRRIVHSLRGRMDAVVVGAGTVTADDPLLTARPPGPRAALRIVLDSTAKLQLNSKLVQSAGKVPVLAATLDSAPEEKINRLREAGVEVLSFEAADGKHVPLQPLLNELGRRKFTNILVEGGGAVLGSFFDGQLIDEAHVFVAPKIVGGATARSPVLGIGLESIPQFPSLDAPQIDILDGDVYIHGLVNSGHA